MKTGFLSSSRYSPGNMNRGSLETLFVGRRDVMEDVLTRATGSIEASQKHYILLVGPRGSGKTHFLTLAHHRLMDHVEAVGAVDRVAVALLKEEEWGVASYLDLVVRILRALADERPELDGAIGDVYATFAKDPAAAEALATKLLRGHTRGKTLLLLCENLIDLFDGLGDEGQKRWRAAIQQDGNWAVVATTPQLSAALTLQENPFFGFFTIRVLDRMDLDTGIELLSKKAIHEGKAELAEFLRTPIGRARVRAIHHLAAGNHRAYVVLFDFLDKESLDDLVEPFMHMVDDLTPYYQDRMRQLAPTQRKILEYLCLEGRPVTVKDIATPCLMSQQTAAKQIGELENAGFVGRTRSGRNTFCELSEPLMRICIEVKDNNTGHFRLFVEFLRHWFTTRELQQRQGTLHHDDHDADVDRLHVEEAIRCSLSDSHAPFVDALHDEAKRCRDAGDYRGLATVQEALARDGGRARDFGVWVYALVMAQDSAAAVSAAHEALAVHPDNGRLLYELAHAYFAANRVPDALDTINQAIDLDPEKPANHCYKADILLRLKRFEEAIAEAETVLVAEPDHWHSFEQIMEALVGLDRTADADARASDLVELAPDDPRALLAASRFHFSQHRLDRALELADCAVDIDADHQSTRQLRGLILLRMSEYRRASKDLRHFAKAHPQSVRTHCRLADALLYGGEFEEAVQVADHLLHIDPGHDHAHYVRGRALMELGRAEAAIAAFDKLMPTTNWRSLLSVAAYVQRLEHFAAAARYLDRVEELAPTNLGLWMQRTRLAIQRDAFDAALGYAAKVETLPNGSLLGRLFAAQATAATEPLTAAWETLGAVDAPAYKRREQLHRRAFVAVLAVSLRKFGPRHLAEGLTKLRVVLGCLLDDGVLGAILTDLLIDSVDSLAGALHDWEVAIDSIASSLGEFPDCRIPLEMLRAAVQYTKTADEKHLLRLPLEQRELLRDVLPSAATVGGSS